MFKVLPKGGPPPIDGAEPAAGRGFWSQAQKSVFFLFVLVEIWRLCLLELSWSHTGLLEGWLAQWSYALYFAGMFLGVLLGTLLYGTLLLPHPRCYLFCVTASAAMAGLSFWGGGVLPAISFTLSVAFSAVSIVFCLRRAVVLIPFSWIGRFLGGVSALMGLMGVVFFRVLLCPPEKALPVAGIVLFGSFLLYRQIEDPGDPKEESAAGAPVPKGAVAVAGALGVIYCLILGLMESVFAFEDAFLLFPDPSVLTWVLYILAYLAAGFLIDSRYRLAPLLISFGALALGQGLSFFSDHTILALPYLVLNVSALALLEVYLLAAPLLLGSRYPKLLPFVAAGYFCYYLFYFISVLQQALLPPISSVLLQGVILVLALGAMLLCHGLVSYLGKIKHAGGSPPSRKEALSRFVAAYPFTTREAEVLENILTSEKSIKELAEALYISERMLYRHLESIYKKTGTNSRIGLMLLCFETRDTALME